MTTHTIKFKRGIKSKLNELSYGEPAYISDENELYIGTEDGVEKITRNKEVAELNSQLEHIANKGTTVEVLERVTKEEIDRQIADGTISNLTIADKSITRQKLGDDVDLVDDFVIKDFFNTCTIDANFIDLFKMDNIETTETSVNVKIKATITCLEGDCIFTSNAYFTTQSNLNLEAYGVSVPLLESTKISKKDIITINVDTSVKKEFIHGRIYIKPTSTNNLKLDINTEIIYEDVKQAQRINSTHTREKFFSAKRLITKEDIKVAENVDLVNSSTLRNNLIYTNNINDIALKSSTIDCKNKIHCNLTWGGYIKYKSFGFDKECFPSEFDNIKIVYRYKTNISSIDTCVMKIKSMDDYTNTFWQSATTTHNSINILNNNINIIDITSNFVELQKWIIFQIDVTHSKTANLLSEFDIFYFLIDDVPFFPSIKKSMNYGENINYEIVNKDGLVLTSELNKNNENLSNDLKQFVLDNKNTVVSDWNGKNLVILGDSYSDASNSHPKYYNYTCSKLGLNLLRNYAVGGARICPKKFESGVGVADGNSLHDHLNNANFTNTDVIVIEYGINDFFSSTPLGEIKGAYATSYDLDTFAGALENSLKRIHDMSMTTTEQLPLIVLVTPTLSHTIGTEANSIGLRTDDYANIIRNIADRWGLPVCDWLRGSGWNKHTVQNNVTSKLGVANDGCHPNELGAKKLGKILASCIDNYY